MPNTFTLGHALCIGVGKYLHHPEMNVPVTATDAQSVADTLLDGDLCGYLKKNVSLKSGQEATRQEILTALQGLVKIALPNTTLFLFYSGHGCYGTDGKYYLTTHDTRVELIDNKKYVTPGSGIAEDELIERLRLIPAKRMLLVFNACHAGEISPVLGDPQETEFGSLQPPARLVNGILSAGEGKVIISACRPAQYSHIGKGKLTIFTQALVDGLSGKGSLPDNHGYIGAYALYEYIYTTVRQAVKQLGKLQEAELTVLKGVGPFPVALYKGAASLGDFDGAADALPDPTSPRQVTFQVSGGFVNIGFNVAGNVYMAGGDIYINQTGPSAGVLAPIFAEIMARVEGLPADDQDIVKPVVEQIRQHVQNVQNGDQTLATQAALGKRLKALANLAPQVSDIMLALLTSPASGLVGAVRNCAEKVISDQ